ARDRVMASLVTVESQLKPIRRVLLESLDLLKEHPEFAALAAPHHEAATLAADIVANDDQSLASLREAELARRYAAESLKQGETTLAAYRPLVPPPLRHAHLAER